MSQSVILSFLGADRPGLVEAVSTAVSARGGNWLESRMARLGGQFAGVARVAIEAGQVAALRVDFEGLRARGLEVTLVPESSASGSRPVGWLRAHLDLVGQDRPGIVSEVSGVLARHGVNVEDFSSTVESAAMAGGILFRCEAEMMVPDAAALRKVRGALESLAGDLMVDVRPSPARP